MKFTLQATGHAPVEIEASCLFSATEHLEKRGVSVELFQVFHGYVAAIHYLTTWGLERPFTRLFGPEQLNDIASIIRTAAKDVLPPGAGYPATPSYETRQAKLKGQLEVLTLVCLSRILADIQKS